MRRFAILLGHGRAHAIQGAAPLRGVESDVDGVGGALIEAAGFHPDDVIVLGGAGGGPEERATRTRWIAAIEGLAGRMSPDDLVVLFFAAHGVETPAGPALLLDGDSLPARDIARYAAGLAARHLIVIFDACRDGADATSLPPEVIRAALQGEPADRMGAAHFLFSSSAGERSWEAPAARCGLFSRRLEEGIRAAAWRDGTLTIGALAAFVTAAVARDAERAGVRQTPVYLWPLAGPPMVLVGERRPGFEDREDRSTSAASLAPAWRLEWSFARPLALPGSRQVIEIGRFGGAHFFTPDAAPVRLDLGIPSCRHATWSGTRGVLLAEVDEDPSRVVAVRLDEPGGAMWSRPGRLVRSLFDGAAVSADHVLLEQGGALEVVDVESGECRLHIETLPPARGLALIAAVDERGRVLWSGGEDGGIVRASGDGSVGPPVADWRLSRSPVRRASGAIGAVPLVALAACGDDVVTLHSSADRSCVSAWRHGSERLRWLGVAPKRREVGFRIAGPNPDATDRCGAAPWPSPATIRFAHAAAIVAAAVDVARCRVVTLGADGAARVWDVETGALVAAREEASEREAGAPRGVVVDPVSGDLAVIRERSVQGYRTVTG